MAGSAAAQQNGFDVAVVDHLVEAWDGGGRPGHAFVACWQAGVYPAFDHGDLGGFEKGRAAQWHARLAAARQAAQQLAAGSIASVDHRPALAAAQQIFQAVQAQAQRGLRAAVANQAAVGQ